MAAPTEDAPWLAVVGIGEDGLAGLSAHACRLLDRAEVVVGGRRHLALIPPSRAFRVVWTAPILQAVRDLARYRGRPTVVLASGDPLWYGVGRLVARVFVREEVIFVPHVSSFQLACARLGWPLEETVTTTVHGRPLARLRRAYAPGARILALTADEEGPARIAELLCQDGFADAPFHVLAHLGGPREARWHGRAAEARGKVFAELNLVGFELPDDPARPLPPRTPGLPEALFRHDGRITKAEVRASALAALAPQPGHILWDVGAGSGAVAIEWLRSTPWSRAVAIEKEPKAAARIRENAQRLGVPELQLVEGEAPAALPEEPSPHAIFVGGGLDAPGLLETCAERLRPGGRLVAHAVTATGEARLLAFAEARGGELVRLQTSRLVTVGRRRVWRALAPITRLVWTRPA